MNQLQVHLAEATDSLAHIHLRPSKLDWPTHAMFAGRLTGPRCRYARTLPAVFPVRNSSDAAEVLITEPCYWTADLPFLYDLQVDVREGDSIVGTIEQAIGLRRLNIRGPSVFVEGKRIVFRAAHAPSDISVNWQAWRDARLAMFVIDPDEDLCHSAGDEGVWIIAAMSSGSVANRVMNCAAVAIVVVPAAEIANVQRFSGGPLIGARMNNGNSRAATAGADLIVYEVQDIAVAKRELAGCSLPVIAIRSEQRRATLADARTACEQLQRELTPELCLAGYVV